MKKYILLLFIIHSALFIHAQKKVYVRMIDTSGWGNNFADTASINALSLSLYDRLADTSVAVRAALVDTASAIRATIAALPTTNLYTADGTISDSVRNVTLGSNDINFDANTLFIDGSADRVGIGTATPVSKLDVKGDAYINGHLVGRGGGNLFGNMALGISALTNNTTGSNNFVMGTSALTNNTTGSTNTAVGVLALTSNTTGNSHVAIGGNALYSNTTGSDNTAIGVNALSYNTTGYYNGAFSIYSLFHNTTGYYNTAVGAFSGTYTNAGGNNETSNNSLYLGYDTRSSASGNTNEIVIGANARGEGSNTAIIGSSSITETILNGNVGISNNAPEAKLQIGSFTESLPPTYRGDIIAYNATRTTINSTGGIELPVAGDGYGVKIQAISDAGAALSFGLRNANASWSETMRINANGRLGINTTSPSVILDVNGQIRARTWSGSNTFTVCRDANGVLVPCTSDSRLKRNISPIDSSQALGKVLDLVPVTYRWKAENIRDDIDTVAIQTAKAMIDSLKMIEASDTTGEIRQHIKDQREILRQARKDIKDRRDAVTRYNYGFIAQQVRGVDEILSGETDDGYLTVHNDQITSLLVGAIKAQEARIKSQEMIIADLIARVTALEDK